MVDMIQEAKVEAEYELPTEPVETEAVEEEAHEVQEDTNDAAATQAVDPVVAPEDVEKDAIWNRAFPDLSGMRSAISPEAQEKMLYGKILSATTPANQETDESESPPTIRPVPKLDKKAAQDLLMQQISDGDLEAAKETRAKIDEYDDALVGALYDNQMLSEWRNKRTDATLAKIQRPNEIREAGADVDGFTESDIAAVSKILDSGDIPNIKVAVRYVVAQRKLAQGVKPQPSAADAAARQLQATQAASAPDSRSVSAPPHFEPTPSFKSPAFVAALKYDAEQRALREQA